MYIFPVNTPLGSDDPASVVQSVTLWHTQQCIEITTAHLIRPEVTLLFAVFKNEHKQVTLQFSRLTDGLCCLMAPGLSKDIWCHV